MKEVDDHHSQGPTQDRRDETQIHSSLVLSPTSLYGRRCHFDLAPVSLSVRGEGKAGHSQS